MRARGMPCVQCTLWGCTAALPPPPPLQVVHELAAHQGCLPEAISVLSVQPGSVLLTLSLPPSAAASPHALLDATLGGMRVLKVCTPASPTVRPSAPAACLYWTSRRAFIPAPLPCRSSQDQGWPTSTSKTAPPLQMGMGMG